MGKIWVHEILYLKDPAYPIILKTVTNKIYFWSVVGRQSRESERSSHSGLAVFLSTFARIRFIIFHIHCIFCKRTRKFRRTSAVLPPKALPLHRRSRKWPQKALSIFQAVGALEQICHFRSQLCDIRPGDNDVWQKCCTFFRRHRL